MACKDVGQVLINAIRSMLQGDTLLALLDRRLHDYVVPLKGHEMFYDVYTAWVTVDFHSPVELDMESLDLQYNSCGNFQKVRGKFKKVV
ncbi:hypothetical protein GOP47_0010594 [Adiantum capillus-veneris]|uniref:Uncharacterized protein n=1 Tax=Adiantum capillus-veneris TaxID=13818 RepID=A0A9D4ZGI0_ADICA|nr:hypothetical protein GOP47_0010594 [Adiantum capillus-veneris]